MNKYNTVLYDESQIAQSFTFQLEISVLKYNTTIDMIEEYKRKAFLLRLLYFWSEINANK